MDHNQSNPSEIDLTRRALLQKGALSLGALAALSSLAPAAAIGTNEEEEGIVPEGLFDGADTLFASSCPVTPPDVEGPYWLNLGFMRRDISEGLQGLPFTIYLKIYDATTCSPVSGAIADLWHDSPTGKYSGFASEGTQGETYLRGIQATNQNGIVRFDSVFPGWYPGRTPHMHLKVNPSSTSELTTQLYFEDSLSARIYTNAAPYDSRGVSPVTNGTDGFFSPDLLVNNTIRGGRLIVGKKIVIA